MRRLGDNNLPAVGLGCMGMSEFYGAADEPANLALLGRAAELGYVHFDTADMYGYGANESLLGRFLASTARDQAFVATKFGIVREPSGLSRSVNGRPEYVREACERSLSRLGIDHIDLYYMHRRDLSVPIEETVGAMGELVAAGKVRYLGLSEVSTETLERAHATHPIAAVQSEYSLLSREPEAALLPACRRLGVAFVAYSPLSRGLLSAKLERAAVLAAGDARQFFPRFSDVNFDRNRRLALRLEELALQRGCTSSQLAIAWVLAQGEFIHAIPGTRHERYLRENFAAGQLALSAAEVAAIGVLIDDNEVAGARYPAAALQGIER